MIRVSWRFLAPCHLPLAWSALKPSKGQSAGGKEAKTHLMNVMQTESWFAKPQHQKKTFHPRGVDSSDQVSS